MQQPKNLFPSKVDSTNPTEYPFGEAQNITVSGDATGTPWNALLINDWFGFFNRMLTRYAITPSGNAETALESQLEQSINVAAMRTQAPKNRRVVRSVADLGLSSVAPECTPVAYEMAGRAGFWGASVNARLSSDEIWVCITDSTVDRTTINTGDVDSFTFAALTAMDAGLWFDPDYYYSGTVLLPALDTVCNTCLRYSLHPIVNIPLTTITPTNAQDLLDTIKESFPDYNFTITSPFTDVLDEIRALDPKAHLGYLSNYTTGAVDIAEGLGNCELIINYQAISGDIDYATGKGVEVWSTNHDNKSGMNTSMGRGISVMYSTTVQPQAI